MRMQASYRVIMTLKLHLVAEKITVTALQAINHMFKSQKSIFSGCLNNQKNIFSSYLDNKKIFLVAIQIIKNYP